MPPALWNRSARRRSLALAAILMIGSASALAADTTSPGGYASSVPMAPRLQWDPNFGYCGETSMIMAGMRFGQYTSQWTARRLASARTNQTLEASQLLLGVSPPDGNAVTAATGMRLNMVSYDSAQPSNTPGYLAWIKQHVVQGDSVTIGMLTNRNILGQDTPGDSEYDHIVPVIRVSSEQPLEGANAGTYFPTDTLTINDLETPRGNTADNPAGSTLYTYRFDAVQKTRRQANRGSGPENLYSVLKASGADGSNYAVAVTGVTDTSPGGPYVIPVAVTSSRNNEGLPTTDPMRTPPRAKSMTLTVTVTIPDSAKAYRLYEYTNFKSVPRGSFNAAATASPRNVARIWDIPAGTGPEYILRLPGLSTAGTYAFRAVPTSAP